LQVFYGQDRCGRRAGVLPRYSPEGDVRRTGVYCPTEGCSRELLTAGVLVPYTSPDRVLVYCPGCRRRWSIVVDAEMKALLEGARR
jgi:hypothetical protein